MDRTIKLILVLAFVLTGCGSSAPETRSSATSSTSSPTESATTTEPVEKSAVFDLSPIAGEWSGVLGANRDATARFPVELQFDDQGRRGSVVAEIEYTMLDGTTNDGTLSALRADGNEYLFFQTMANGGWTGQVRILHNAGADELAFRVTMEGFDGVFSGTLEREQ